MSEITPITQGGAAYAASQGRGASGVPTSTAQHLRSGDSVELSQSAQMVGGEDDGGEVRLGLVNQIRSEIESGTYVTDEKINAAIDSLASDL